MTGYLSIPPLPSAGALPAPSERQGSSPQKVSVGELLEEPLVGQPGCSSPDDGFYVQASMTSLHHGSTCLAHTQSEKPPALLESIGGGVHHHTPHIFLYSTSMVVVVVTTSPLQSLWCLEGQGHLEGQAFN